jgi:glyoxylase-like metal-dependent hydrolase (beta-lactamase superfamily II)
MTSTPLAVVPTKQTLFDASAGGAIPVIEQLDDRVWAIPSPMPVEALRYTLTYAILDDVGHVHLVDPGWDTPENRDGIGAALATIGRSLDDVVSSIVTHVHDDHLGLAMRLRTERGIPITMGRRQQPVPQGEPETVSERMAKWGVPDDRLDEFADRPPQSGVAAPAADVVVEHGDLLDVPGLSLRVIPTAGHTWESISLVSDDRGLLFTGDHLLSKTFPGIGLGGLPTDTALEAYFASLDRLERFADHQVLPGHEFPFVGLTTRLAETRAHHLRRSAEVAAALERRPEATVWEVASQLTWTAGWENLHGFYLVSALNQAEMQAAFVTTEAYRRLLH